MASLSSKVTQGTVTEFINRFGRFGGTEELIRRLNGDDELMREWTEELLGRLERSAELFTSTADQLTRVKQWNKERNWGFTDEDFEQLGDAPELPEDAGKLVCLVLVPYLDEEGAVPGYYRTFQELWRLATQQQENSWRWDGYSNPENLRLLEGIEHPGRCLRWEVIDLGANWNKNRGIAPKDVRNSETSPHAGILAAAALHPNWVRAMDGKNVPYVWISGYQVAVPGVGPWQYVPSVWFGRDGSGVGLYYNWDDCRGCNFAVPAFLRE